MFVAALATETNTFSPIRIDRRAFEEAFYAPSGQHPPTPTLCTAPIIAAREGVQQYGYELIEGTAAWAEPAGLVSCDAYEGLRDEILGQLEAAGHCDIVLLGLHGAMMAQGYEDCEGDLIARVRALVGPDCIIGIELDPHCHLTPAMVCHSDVIVTFKEVPHTDFLERARDLMHICVRAAQKLIKPHLTVLDCRTISPFLTSREPGRSVVDALHLLERTDGVLSISVVHGFPAADMPDVGSKVVVVTDADPHLGRRLAKDICERVRGLGADRLPEMPGPSRAIEMAIAMDGAPVILSDRWDNPGGGVAGDSTFLAHAMLAQPDVSAALGALWDPVAVDICTAAGVGSRIELRVGGKAAPSSGAPLDGTFEVISTTKDLLIPFEQSMVSLGAAVALRLANLDIVVASRRTQTYHPDAFEKMGVTLADKKIAGVKSASHFFAAFEPIAHAIIYVDCGGPYPSDPTKIPYSRLRRPIQPIDDVAEPQWMTSEARCCSSSTR